MKSLFLLSFGITIIFYVISQKNVYEFTNRLVGDELDELGCPTQKGILFHSLIAGGLFYMMSYILE